MRSSRRTIAAWSTTAALGLAVAAGVGTVALADPPQRGLVTAAAEKNGADKGDRTAKRKAIRRAAARAGVHGEFVVKRDGKFVTILTQKGEVTAASATSLTVRSEDGFSATYVLNADTKRKRVGEKGTDATPKVGDTVLVRARKDGTDSVARHVLIRKK